MPMSSLYINQRRYGNWNINLSVLLCNLNIITSQSCDLNNVTRNLFLPSDWPCAWNNGVIPYVFDYFSLSPKRLTSLVLKGHNYIQQRSCLVFQEQNPKEAAKKGNFTYLFYTYSEVLESCCLQFFTKSIGRRLVLITPVCSLPAEIGHATLHGLGLGHNKHDTFADHYVKAALFVNKNCTRGMADDYEYKDLL